jgi:hypothetical protein
MRGVVAWLLALALFGCAQERQPPCTPEVITRIVIQPAPTTPLPPPPAPPRNLVRLTKSLTYDVCSAEDRKKYVACFDKLQFAELREAFAAQKVYTLSLLKHYKEQQRLSSKPVHEAKHGEPDATILR